ncbi:hypothetical protein F4821DRAFT_280494 [Hypoxylon rubiginosum]|uniref:Uncharacterized protein n=1 Tax=Hypoxylon rubiginosum TaxID=110542 RepID=A0ACC0CU90_9PEZI|nr:hypothetical protein F4821DRAFT_280494 [Hypoxylon rubiginosum]
MPDCELISDACVCSKLPCHQRFDCKEKCKYREFAGKTADPHLVTECQEICHYCFATDHLILNCIRFVGGAHDDRDPCRFCNSGKWHLPTNCIEVWCPVRRCKTPIECDEHCPKCGWEKHLDKELTDAGKPVHTCLWTKEFDTDTPDRRVVLKCLKMRTTRTCVPRTFRNAANMWRFAW